VIIVYYNLIACFAIKNSYDVMHFGIVARVSPAFFIAGQDQAAKNGGQKPRARVRFLGRMLGQQSPSPPAGESGTALLAPTEGCTLVGCL